MRQRVPHPATPRELLRVLKIPRDDRHSFKRNLRSLVNEGALVEIKGNRYGLPDRMDLVIGKLDGHPSGFGFVAPERPVEGLTRDIYVAAHNLQEALHGDRVVVRIERYREDGRAEGKVQIGRASCRERWSSSEGGGAGKREREARWSR